MGINIRVGISEDVRRVVEKSDGFSCRRDESAENQIQFPERRNRQACRVFGIRQQVERGRSEIGQKGAICASVHVQQAQVSERTMTRLGSGHTVFFTEES